MALGEVDYGLIGVVGELTAFICFLEWNHNWRNGIELGGLTEWQYLLYQWSVPLKALFLSLH